MEILAPKKSPERVISRRANQLGVRWIVSLRILAAWLRSGSIVDQEVRRKAKRALGGLPMVLGGLERAR